MSGILQQIADLEAEYARTQKNKATECVWDSLARLLMGHAHRAAAGMGRDADRGLQTRVWGLSLLRT